MSRPEKLQQSPQPIEALLNYLVYTGEKPASYGGISSFAAIEKRKGTYKEYPTRIYDGRAIADQLSLEREGFVFVTHETMMRGFYDEQEIRSVYYREIEQLVKDASGAQRVLVFDHTLRSADDHMREQKQISGPVRNVHNDLRNGQDHNEYEICCPMKPNNYCITVSPLSRCGARLTSRYNESRWLLRMAVV